jgi:hypothetical protein
MTAIDIRPATPSDVPTILHFVHSLADSVSASSKVLATTSTLAKTLGLETPPSGPSSPSLSPTTYIPGQFAKCILAWMDDVPVGFAVYYYNYSTVVPPWFY